MPVFYETFPTLNPNAADISLEEKSRRSTYQGRASVNMMGTGTDT